MNFKTLECGWILLYFLGKRLQEIFSLTIFPVIFSFSFYFSLIFLPEEFFPSAIVLGQVPPGCKPHCGKTQLPDPSLPQVFEAACGPIKIVEMSKDALTGTHKYGTARTNIIFCLIFVQALKEGGWVLLFNPFFWGDKFLQITCGKFNPRVDEEFPHNLYLNLYDIFCVHTCIFFQYYHFMGFFWSPKSKPQNWNWVRFRISAPNIWPYLGSKFGRKCGPVLKTQFAYKMHQRCTNFCLWSNFFL